jgi:DNA-binding CsgD family transcriptional regulator
VNEGALDMDEIGSLILSIYESAREVPMAHFQKHALDLLAKYVHFDKAKWGSVSVTNRGVSFHSPYLYNDSPDVGAAYEEVRDQDIVPRQVLLDPHNTRNFPLFRLYRNNAEMRGIRAYTEKFRHHHALVTAFPNPGATFVRSVALYGAHERHPFEEAQRQFVRAIMPHMMEAWNINLTIHSQGMNSSMPKSAWSRVIADTGGNVLFAEARARELLRLTWPEGTDERLSGDLLHAIASKPNSFRAVRSLIVRATVHSGLAFIFLRLQTESPIGFLTPRQQEVASCIAKGLTHKEISRKLEISPATARNHIQAVLRRSGVRKSSALASLIREVD